ncbi:hypothetical protein HPB49_000118 [Dermacentor silvarum]|uniref:Uncharacterized protein n=1 Tax=Dermacentor silvarum TaxID=543639 RepID=A0ACB8D1T2_DERSI|nr:hypothetical protein HPB49_000118 [Dermacentor silvarum]
MARSVRGSSAAAAGRGDRFSSAPSDYRILLPTLPSGESMQQPYRLEDFREPLEEAGIIKNITGIGAFQMNHIWLVKLRSKADKDALVNTGGLQVKGGFCAVIDPIQQDVTCESPLDDVQENIMDAEEAEKSAPNSNIKEHVGKVQETDAKKAGGAMPDSQDLTKATEERAETVCTQEAPLLSQASEEEDMSDCTETTTEEEKAESTGATTARGKRLRTGILKLTEDSTECKVKHLERGAEGPRLHTASSLLSPANKSQRKRPSVARMISRVATRRHGMREEDTLKLIRSLVVSRMTYSLPYQRLTKGEQDQVESMLRKAYLAALCLTETWNNNKQGGQEARGEGAVGEQGFAPVVRARAVDARSRAGGVDVYYRNVRWRGGMVRHSWSYADTRGEYAGFTAVCDDAYRHGHGQDDGEITVITFYLSPKPNRDAVAEFLELAMNDHRRQQRRQPEQPETQRQRRPIVIVGDFNVDVRKDDWIDGIDAQVRTLWCTRYLDWLSPTTMASLADKYLKTTYWPFGLKNPKDPKGQFPAFTLGMKYMSSLTDAFMHSYALSAASSEKSRAGLYVKMLQMEYMAFYPNKSDAMDTEQIKQWNPQKFGEDFSLQPFLENRKALMSIYWNKPTTDLKFAYIIRFQVVTASLALTYPPLRASMADDTPTSDPTSTPTLIESDDPEGEWTLKEKPRLAARPSFDLHAVKVHLPAPSIRNRNRLAILKTHHIELVSRLLSVESILLGGRIYAVASYLAAPANSCRGVIHGVAPDAIPEELLRDLDCYQADILLVRHVGNTNSARITIVGMHVPFSVYY